MVCGDGGHGGVGRVASNKWWRQQSNGAGALYSDAAARGAPARSNGSNGVAQRASAAAWRKKWQHISVRAISRARCAHRKRYRVCAPRALGNGIARKKKKATASAGMRIAKERESISSGIIGERVMKRGHR
jgi:hypothetical protein